MNVEQFKSTFLLSPLAKKQRIFPAHLNGHKKAAVLVPFVVREGSLHLLLTQRSSKLKHHPGQVSFPGGRFEPQDQDLLNTALRETEEETGIEARSVSIIGQLVDYQTISNFVVTPYVGLVDNDYRLKIDHNEVEAVFEVPWQFFVERVNHHELEVKRRGKQHKVHFMPYQDRMIWGTTALIIHDLVSHFE